MNSTFRKIGRFIAELILTLAIICFSIMYVVSSTILNESYILNSLEKSDYYAKIHELVESNFEKYVGPSGLDESVLKNLVSKEDIEEDTKKIVSNIYDGLNETVDTTKIEEKLKNNIDNSLNGKELSATEKISVNRFIQEIINEYKSTISHLEFENKIHETVKKISDFIEKAKKILIVVIGISLVALILLSIKRIYKIAVNIGISIFASGLTLTGINIYINSKVDVKYLSILNDQISGILQDILGTILSGILKYGIFMLLIGFVLILISNIVHNIQKYKEIIGEE